VNAVLIPYPPIILSPNSRTHYMTKHKAVSAYRKLTAYHGAGKKCLQNPVCAIVPLVTTRRRRDIDNVLASLKAALDGLTDAGWWKDDHDIRGYHLVPEIYSPKFGDKKILIVACEQEHEQELAVRVKRFREQVDIGLPETALATYFDLISRPV